MDCFISPCGLLRKDGKEGIESPLTSYCKILLILRKFLLVSSLREVTELRKIRSFFVIARSRHDFVAIHS